MNKIDYFKKFIFYSCDVIADVEHLYVKRIYLVNFSYLVIEDLKYHMVYILLMSLCIEKVAYEAHLLLY
jgi:hypothetical protein